MSDSLCSFENDSVPKVRKPYTITKQREKWTEEEHQRFLEALKLYGRGWRQIEEHVGTKTAVQIRSHAQKFFSKMVRDSNGSAESSIKPIEIPPPRPKRKPAHPYPRKSVDSLTGIPVSKENCTPSNALVSDKNVQSPTSVLSTFGSDSLGAPASDQQNGCSSPTSCTTEMHSVNLLPTEKENEYGASKLSPKAENISTLSTQLSVSSNMENLVPVKIEPNFKDPGCTQEDAAMGPNCTSIKLFGRTVLVTEFQKPNSVVADSYKSSVFKKGQGVNTVSPVPTSPSKCLDTHLSLGTVASTCNPSADGALLFPYMELPEEKTSNAEASPGNCLPWYPLYQGVPLIHLMSNSQNLVSAPPQFRVKEKEDLSGKSCTGSSTSSVSELENREKSSDVAVDSLCSPSSRVRLRKCTKGFVPYKRCLTESGIKSSLIASEDRERQGTRVCS